MAIFEASIIPAKPPEIERLSRRTCVLKAGRMGFLETGDAVLAAFGVLNEEIAIIL